MAEILGEQKRAARLCGKRGAACEALEINWVEDDGETIGWHAARQAAIAAEIVDGDPAGDLWMRTRRFHFETGAVAGEDGGRLRESGHRGQRDGRVLGMNDVGSGGHVCGAIDDDVAARAHAGGLGPEGGREDHRLVSSAAQAVGQQFDDDFGSGIFREEEVRDQDAQSRRSPLSCGWAASWAPNRASASGRTWRTYSIR